eukprot:CAMPEP_0113487038 /NCGR_PEP_ID=MMETSP0014_2-20120614/25305_1 /TAXON_ID=2857 /ORGANISM="Nitzschia sp." /LENGTH=268 /DNA_ID=CAMNT_0000380727 /DNA_START=87 /DNA_END=893 /DNA_ORIENTATION=+ /assembly_acc=CAM_ASM_000159
MASIMRSPSYISCFCMYLLVSFVVVSSSFGIDTTGVVVVVVVEGFSSPSSYSYGIPSRKIRRSATTTTTTTRFAAATVDGDDLVEGRTTNGIVQSAPSTSISSRRSFMLTKLVPAALFGVAAISPSSVFVQPAAAADTTTDSTTPAKKKVRYVLDEETGDYIEVEEETWQEAWRGRWNEASTMSTDQIFEAARGAGNLDKKSMEEESPSSKKRRALSACRNPEIRSRINTNNNSNGGGNNHGPLSERDCTARILKDGEIDFILNVLGS